MFSLKHHFYTSFYTVLITALTLEDAIRVNCDPSNWRIVVNMTLLRMIYPDSGVSQIYLSKQSCYGHVINDTVVFDHSYTNCSTSKTVKHSYFFISHLTANLDYFLIFLIVLKKEYFKPDS